MPNCKRPPHFPPHCGCPAGVVPTEGTFLVRDGKVWTVTDFEPFVVAGSHHGHEHLAISITPLTGGTPC